MRKVRTGFMPPLGEPRPERAVLDGMAAWFEEELDAAWVRAPNPGAKPLARLNRTEYANAIRDLLAYDGSAIASALPPDVDRRRLRQQRRRRSACRRRCSKATLQPRCKSAAARSATARWATARFATRRVGRHGPARPSRACHSARAAASPSSTRSRWTPSTNSSCRHRFRSPAGKTRPGKWSGATARRWTSRSTARRVARRDPRRFRLRVPAGPQRITVALVDERAVRRCERALSRRSGARRRRSGDSRSTGRSIATGAGDTPSRREIFVCRPDSAAEETPCAEQILSRLATRAYRRPVAAGERRSRASSCSSIEWGARRAVISRSASNTRCRGCSSTRGSSIDSSASPRSSPSATSIASTISSSRRGCRFSSGAAFPMTSCSRSPRRTGCTIRDVLAAQVERMLADERSSALVENFASQWLLLRELDDRRAAGSRNSTTDLRAAFRRETELLFADVAARAAQRARRFSTRITRILNERLAVHYGIDGVRGSQMRRVGGRPDSPRRGVLGHGSVLTATSAPNRTSPVVRGQWLMQSLLGAKVPTPAAGRRGRSLGGSERIGRLVGDTVRERLEMHRANPTCAGCHGIMDPLGLGARELRFARAVGATARTAMPIDAAARHGRRHGAARARRICVARCSRVPTSFVATLSRSGS